MSARLAKLRTPTTICVVLLSAHALLLAWSAAANSATFDEPAHLAAGAEYWRRGDFTIYCLSPPLPRLWAGAAAILAGAKTPPTGPAWQSPISSRHWQYADLFVAANPRFPWLLMLGRWGMIPISCLAGWVTWRWAKALYGPASGAAACALYCLNPSVLAHGSLVTTDLATAAAMLAAAWLWWKFLRRPSLPLWALVCLAVVAAHLCKFTAVLLWPMLLAMTAPFMFYRPRFKRWRIFAWWLALGLATLLIVNALYGFRGTGEKLSSFDLTSEFMQKVQQRLPSGFRSPLPGLIVRGMDAQRQDTQGGYEAFLFGTIYAGSRWYYYPLALLCKMPIAMLLLAAAALASALVRARPPGRRMEEWSLCLAGAVFVYGVMALGDVNIGTRYLLPAFPLAMILISRVWSMDPAAAQGKRAPLPPRRAFMPYVRDGLLVMLALETLWVCPRFLSFVNFAAGGPSNGWRLLSDSDFDWGQGLIDLRHWMDHHPQSRIALAYFGYINPAAYGIKFQPITDPGSASYYAVSSYYLDGLWHRMMIGHGQRRYMNLPYYQVLQNVQPDAKAGYTIFIYTRRQVLEAMLRGPYQPRAVPPPP